MVTYIWAEGLYKVTTCKMIHGRNNWSSLCFCIRREREETRPLVTKVAIVTYIWREAFHKVTNYRKVLTIFMFLYVKRDRRDQTPGNPSNRGHLFFGGGVLQGYHL